MGLTGGWGRLEAYDCGKKEDVIAVHGILMVLAITEFFVSIVASCFGCCNGCGGNSNTVVVHPQPQVAMTTTQYAQPQHPPMYNQQPVQPQPYPQTQPQPQPQLYPQPQPQPYLQPPPSM